MLKFKKSIPLIIAFIMLFSTIHVFANESTEKISQPKIRATVYVELKETYTKENFFNLYSPKEIKEIEEVFKHKIIYNDDTVNIISKTVVNPKVFPDGLTVFADGVEIPIEDDGTVLIPTDTKIVSRYQKVNPTTFSKTNNEDANNPLLITEPNIKDKNNPEIVFSDDVVNVLKTMQEKADAYNENVELLNKITPRANHKRVETKPYGSKYYEGDDVHCNRFNGPQSDWRHYNWRNPSQLDKALKNFRGSDCQAALAVGSGCPTKGPAYCNNKYGPAWCSSFTIYKTKSGTTKRCPKKFHKHQNGPASDNWT